MKINIIGTSGAGKTTLAKKIATEKGIPMYSLDTILHQKIKEKKGIEWRTEKEYKKKLSQILRQKNWIIEGVNPIPEVLNHADKIVWLKPSLFTALYRQWKRYVTDKKQRKEHGFINNIKLSQYIIKQHREDIPEKDADFKFVRVKKLERILEPYMSKTVNSISSFD